MPPAAAERETIRRWDATRDSYQDVLSRYADYETDMWKALKYPALHNVDIDETASFLKQLRKVNKTSREQESAKKGTIGGTEELYERLSDEIDKLETLFERAENKALKMEWKTLPDDERKDLKQATQLLKHAENEGNSPKARQTYYEQLQKVIDRLNSRHSYDVIPTATIKLITSKEKQLMLTSYTTSETLNIIDNTEVRVPVERD